MRAIVTVGRRADADIPHWPVLVEVPGAGPLTREMPAQPDDTGRWWPAGTPDERDTLVALTDRPAAAPSILAATREYGRFLLLALLGNDGWKLVSAALVSAALVSAAASPLTEIELRLPPGDADLHGLTWELLHAPDEGGEFLAQDPRQPVMIVRGVVSPAANGRTVQPVTGTARMLFTVGSELHDPEVRAGAEVMAIIRGYDRTSSLIDFRVRSQITVDRLQRACAEVRPHILHLIAHGSCDPESAEHTVQLRAEPGGSAAAEVEHVNARALAEALRGDGELPLIVFLSACESGDTRPGGTAIAAELVAAGVPVVLSMTGRISNTACRTFARAFASAVVKGKPLHLATAEARRLAFSRARDGEIDWALPAVFMATDVPADFTVIDHTQSETLREFLRDLGPECAPVFHARDEFFDLLDHLLDEKDPLAVLLAAGRGATVSPGGTRLLRELSAASLRAGHVPCNVRFVPTDMPKNAAQLAIDVLVAICSTRYALKLDQNFPSVILDGIEDELGPENLAKVLPSRRQGTAVRAKRLRPAVAEIDPAGFTDELTACIRRDLLELATAARREHPGLFTASCRPILLLDEPQQIPDLFRHLGILLSPRGLSAEHSDRGYRAKIPVVLFTKEPAMRPGGARSVLTRALQDEDWARTAEVLLFQEMTPPEYPDFVAAAWRWLVMHPLPKGDGGHTRPLTVIADKEESWAEIVRQQTRGRQVIYSRDLMTAITEAGRAQEVLEEDNDDAALESWQDSRSAA
ncbi:CHAT domain-containing protein [Actinoplanes campanulatus]|uniref:CHAT domain-containing protein n=1 Tax=Actinoplanes campanulatus TaxID=113559 RepID=UPI00195378ED|nr:CHAT domain-containing protein [Actinoplanes capillaceus]